MGLPPEQAGSTPEDCPHPAYELFHVSKLQGRCTAHKVGKASGSFAELILVPAMQPND